MLLDSRVARPLASAGKYGNIFVPALGQVAIRDQFPFLGEIREGLCPGLVTIVPLLLPLGAALDGLPHVGLRFFRHEELRVRRPAIVDLGEADLFRAQRLTVSFSSVLLVRRAPANVTVDDDQRWPLRLVLCLANRAIQRSQIVDVADVLHIPVPRQESAYATSSEKASDVLPSIVM